MMVRSSHYLEPLTGPIKFRKRAVYDIESKHEETQDAGFTTPFLVGFYDPEDREYVSFRNEPHLAQRPWQDRHAAPGGCVDKMLTHFLTRRFKGYELYAHNGGNFDHLFLLSWLRAHDDEFAFSIVPVQSSILKIDIWRLPGPNGKITQRWTLLDTLKLMPMSLEKAAKMFGLKGKEKQDLNVHESDPSWDVYLKQDCLLLWQVLDNFILMVETLGGEVGPTTPSTAMKYYRRVHLKKLQQQKIPRHAHFQARSVLAAYSSNIPNWACVCDPKAEGQGCLHAWVVESYYGGRTEVFQMAGEGLHYYDVNSSYVASMHDMMPGGDYFVEDHYQPRHHERSVGFIECTVEIPETCHIPPLPYRDVKLGKLIFPVGTFSGTWSVEEIRLLDHPEVQGRIVSVKKCVWYKRRPLFVTFVDEVWKMRQELLSDGSPNPEYNEGRSSVGKLLGNSAYGKFGMKQDRTQVVFAKKEYVEGTCILCKKDAVDDGEFCEGCEGSKPAMEDESDVYYQNKFVDAPYIIPQIAAHITALARVRLWNFMQLARSQGGKVCYCDSVTGDRTTVVRFSGRIEVLTFEDLWSRGEALSTSRGKEFLALEGYEALTHKGWSPIERILRHRSGKTTHRISTKDGQTQVTSDHGIMVDGEETTPMDFVSQKASFTKVRPPESVPLELVDIFSYLSEWQHSLPRQKPLRDQSYAFSADSDSVFIRSEWDEQRGVEPLRIRRFYARGSKELHALVRLIGTYACDGSASIAGMTTESRFMLSFCKQHLSVVERVKADLETIAPAIRVFGPHWTDTTYVVRSGTATMACFFAALCGVKSLDKRLPSFSFALDEFGFDALFMSFAEGDGPLDFAGQMRFTSTSQRLTASLSFVLAQHRVEHGFTFRVDKEVWFLRTRPVGSARKGRVINQEVFETSPDEWVYDLTVPGTQTFVDGIGQVLLHNTDSVITDVVLPSSTELGEFKDVYPDAKNLKGTFLQAKVYMLESESWETAKVTMKGFSSRERTKEKLGELMAGKTLAWKRLEKVRTLARHGFRRGPQMADVTKSFKSRFDKRVIQPDNMTTKPIVLREEVFAVEEPVSGTRATPPKKRVGG